MILRLLITAMIMMLTLSGISSCGNKGDLYRIPDEISEQDLDMLDGALDELDVQIPQSTETDSLDNLTQEERDKLKAKKPGN